MDTQQLARNQLDGVLRAATYISGINYEQRIKELESRNTKLEDALEAVRIEYAELFHTDLVKQIDQALGKDVDGDDEIVCRFRSRIAQVGE